MRVRTHVHTHSHSPRFHVTEKIECGNLREAVCCTAAEDPNECIAKNVSDIFQHIKLLYGTITEFCTPTDCPSMTAGGGFKYLWEESDGSRLDLPAPDYIQRLLTSVDQQIENEAIFPTIPGEPFPDDFQEIVQRIMRRLFRVYAHCYYHHLDRFTRLGTQPHLNTCFRHFVFFAHEFQLIEREQLDPLRDLVDEILRSG
jgi:MOB kinase activator 1